MLPSGCALATHPAVNADLLVFAVSAIAGVIVAVTFWRVETVQSVKSVQWPTLIAWLAAPVAAMALAVGLAGANIAGVCL